MRKAFLIVAGILFVFGANSDALAQSRAKMPVKAQVNYHANGAEGKVEFVTGRHHRRHNQGRYGNHRHGRHFRDHRQGYNKHHYREQDLYRFYKPYGNYYSNRHPYRKRGYNGYKNHDRHDRGYGQGRQYSPKHRH